MKSNKKKIIIPVVIILVLLIIAGITAVLWFFTGIFDFVKPADKLFYSNADKLASMYKVDYSYSDFLEEYKDVYKKSTKGEVNLKAEISLDDEIDQNLQDIINSCKLSYKMASNPSENNMQSILSLYSNDDEVISLDVVQNGTKAGVKCDAVYNKYLAYSMEDAMNFASGSVSKKEAEQAKELMNKFSEVDMYDLLYISDKDLKKLEEAYGNCIKDAISKESFSKESGVKVKVDGKEVSTTAIYLTIDAKDMYNILTKFVKTAKNDDTTIQIITDKINKVLDLAGQSKISENDVKDVIDKIASEIEDSADEIKKEKGAIQIAIYSKNGQPVRLELNVLEDEDDLDDKETVFVAEYAKDLRIYRFKIDGKKEITIENRIEKDKSDEKSGEIAVKYMGIEFGTIKYEIKDKKNESKLLLDARVPLADISFKFEISSEGNYKKEEVKFDGKVELSYGSQYVKLKMDGTTELTDNVSIPTLSSSNSVDILKLSNKEQENLINEITKNAQKELPKRLKLLGIDEKTINSMFSSSNKTSSTTSKPASSSNVTTTTTSSTNTLVATKASSNSVLGEYNEIITFKFTNNVATNVEYAMQFKDSNTAKLMMDAYKDSDEENNNVTVQGDKLIIKMTLAEFLELGDIDDDDTSMYTKSVLKTALESQGYTVK